MFGLEKKVVIHNVHNCFVFCFQFTQNTKILAHPLSTNSVGVSENAFFSKAHTKEGTTIVKTVRATSTPINEACLPDQRNL